MDEPGRKPTDDAEDKQPTARMYEVVFSFLDPSRAVGTVLAETPEQAAEKIKEDLLANCPHLQDLQILEVRELCDTNTPMSDLDSDRSLN